MAYLTGLTLSQTAYTILHLLPENLPLIELDSLRTRHADSSRDPTRPLELVGLVLRAGLMGTSKCLGVMWEEMMKGNLYEVGRIPTVACFERNLQALLSLASRARTSRATSSTSGSAIPFRTRKSCRTCKRLTGGSTPRTVRFASALRWTRVTLADHLRFFLAVDPKWKDALSLRLFFRIVSLLHLFETRSRAHGASVVFQSFLQTLTSLILPTNPASPGCPSFQSTIFLVDRLLPSLSLTPTPSSSSPALTAFDPTINRKLVSQLPLQAVEIGPIADAATLLKQVIRGLEEVIEIGESRKLLEVTVSRASEDTPLAR